MLTQIILTQNQMSSLIISKTEQSKILTVHSKKN